MVENSNTHKTSPSTFPAGNTPLRKRRTFTVKVPPGLTIAASMRALEAHLAIHRAEQERLREVENDLKL
jgi:hypothetical protein